MLCVLPSSSLSKMNNPAEVADPKSSLRGQHLAAVKDMLTLDSVFGNSSEQNVGGLNMGDLEREHIYRTFAKESEFWTPPLVTVKITQPPFLLSVFGDPPPVQTSYKYDPKGKRWICVGETRRSTPRTAKLSRSSHRRQWRRAPQRNRRRERRFR